MAQMIPVACPHCSRTGTVSSEYLGQVVRCEHCREPFSARAAAPLKKAAPAPVERWYVLKDGKHLGPFPLAALQRYAVDGQLKADAWLMLADTDACVLAATVPGLTFRAQRGGKRPGKTATAVPAAPPKPDTVTLACPSCRGACLIPRPNGPSLFACPRCKQPFRTARTPAGFVAQKVDPSLPPQPR